MSWCLLLFIIKAFLYVCINLLEHRTRLHHEPHPLYFGSAFAVVSDSDAWALFLWYLYEPSDIKKQVLSCWNKPIFTEFLDVLVCCTSTNTEQERRMQPSKKKSWMLFSVKPWIYNTHGERKRPSKRNITGLQHKRGSGQSEIDHISLKTRIRKWPLPPMSQILSDTLT